MSREQGHNYEYGKTFSPTEKMGKRAGGKKGGTVAGAACR